MTIDKILRKNVTLNLVLFY